MKKPQHQRVASLTLGVVCRQAPPSDRRIAPDCLLSLAIRLMAEEGLAALLVEGPQGLEGYLSESDIVRAASKGRDGVFPGTMTVGQAMTPCPVAAEAEESVESCLKLLAERKESFLPVRDGGRLIGLLSLADLLARMVHHHERVYREMELDWSLLFIQGVYSC